MLKFSFEVRKQLSSHAFVRYSCVLSLAVAAHLILMHDITSVTYTSYKNTWSWLDQSPLPLIDILGELHNLGRCMLTSMSREYQISSYGGASLHESSVIYYTLAQECYCQALCNILRCNVHSNFFVASPERVPCCLLFHLVTLYNPRMKRDRRTFTQFDCGFLMWS